MFKYLSKFALVTLGSVFLVGSLSAEESKPKAEDLVEKPTAAQTEDRNQLRRAKLTEEQVINQLKFMMVKGWERIEPELLERGSFKPMGLTLSPLGEFRPVYLENQEELPQDFALEAIIKTLKEVAASRTQWAVGVIYVTGVKQDDGSYLRQIMVAAEHIAGWARHWTYPYKVVDGEVKMGTSTEREMPTVYFK